MELALQFGYGMMDHCRCLVKDWGGGGVVLSPRDLKRDQLQRLSDDIRGLPGGRVLFDAQFYFPRSDHHRLTAHDYWPDNYQTAGFFAGPDMASMLDTLGKLNADLGCDVFLLPGLMATQVDDDWLATIRAVAEEASNHCDLPLYATVALGADAVRNTEGVQDVLAELEKLPVAGAYLLFEHPNGDYLVQDPIWIANALDLSAGLKLLGKRVVVGYCNQQMLCLACAGVDTVAAGTWMNVRAFSPDRFQAAQEDEIRRKAIWYYAPSDFSEYKPAFLDVAMRQGVLNALAPPTAFNTIHASALFSGAQPSSVGFGEKEAFRHYLDCMRHQVANARQATFDDTVSQYRAQLDAAEAQLHRKRIGAKRRWSFV